MIWTKPHSTAEVYLWHLLSYFGQVLSFLSNNETMKPRGGRDRGDGKTVGLKDRKSEQLFDGQTGRDLHKNSGPISMLHPQY